MPNFVFLIRHIMFRQKNGMLRSNSTITDIIKTTLLALHLDHSNRAISYYALHIESLFQEYAKLMLIKGRVRNWTFEQIHVLNHFDDYVISPEYLTLSPLTKAFLIQISIHADTVKPASDELYLMLLQIINHNPKRI